MRNPSVPAASSDGNPHRYGTFAELERVFGNFDRSEKSQRRRGLRSGALRAEAARLRSRRVQFYHRQGEAINDLAARFNVSRRTVYRDLRRVTPDQPEWVPDSPLFAFEPPCEPPAEMRTGFAFGTESDQIGTGFAFVTGTNKLTAGRNRETMKELPTPAVARACVRAREVFTDEQAIAWQKAVGFDAEQAWDAAVAHANETDRRAVALADSIINTGRYLIAAKASLGHGEFGKRLNGSFPKTARTAQKWMRAARHYETGHQLLNAGGLNQALTRIALPPAIDPEVERLTATVKQHLADARSHAHEGMVARWHAGRYATQAIADIEAAGRVPSAQIVEAHRETSQFYLEHPDPNPTGECVPNAVCDCVTFTAEQTDRFLNDHLDAILAAA